MAELRALSFTRADLRAAHEGPEALALETPIVASDIPSVREVAGLHETTMLLFPLASTTEMAGSIVQLLQDHKRARDLGQAARLRFLDNFTIDAVADATVKFYRRTVGNH